MFEVMKPFTTLDRRFKPGMPDIGPDEIVGALSVTDLVDRGFLRARDVASPETESSAPKAKKPASIN